jgi:hypothetical protein
MIRHVVMWKFREQNKQEHMDMFREMLLDLDGKIDEILSMSIGHDVNNSDWDMALVMDFNSLSDLNSYISNPQHRKVSEFCKSIRVDRAAVDFEII